MTIHTKFNIDEKVYYFLEDLNKYCWGKIVSMDIEVRVGKPWIIYHVENRFYDKHYHMLNTEADDYMSRNYLSFHEHELSSRAEWLIEDIRKRTNKKLDEISELKKGILHRNLF